MKSIPISMKDNSTQTDMMDPGKKLKMEKQFLFFEYFLFIHSNLIKIIFSKALNK